MKMTQENLTGIVQESLKQGKTSEIFKKALAVSTTNSLRISAVRMPESDPLRWRITLRIFYRPGLSGKCVFQAIRTEYPDGSRLSHKVYSYVPGSWEQELEALYANIQRKTEQPMGFAGKRTELQMQEI